MRIEELDTPAVIVDLDILESTIRSLADYCRAHRLGLRPHTKTHKIPAIAKMQIETGALGITVAKVGEAEVMAAAGLDNILIAYPVLGESKLQRLTRLALEKQITVALDSREALEGISAAAKKASCQIQILIEYDMGMQRCGLQSVSDLVQMARSVDKLPGVRFAGIMFYPGHIWDLPPDQSQALGRLSNRILEIREELGKAGLPCEVVSGGSTPTAYNSHLVQGITEIRPGTYVFNDMNEVGVHACQLSQCALKIVVTVISNAVNGRAMFDGGSKTFSGDRLISGDKTGFGYVTEHPDLKFYSMSEEHGHLDLTQSAYKPRVGEKLTVIPNHVCACVNMHDQLYFHRKGVVEGSWAVAGRGKIR
jgi:D-serine deaminase-like pyridoxal phosphate-dependent protein